MMLDVIYALVPAIAVSIWVFQFYAIVQMGVCVVTCVLTEAIWKKLSGKTVNWMDASAPLTGLILGMSLPWSAPLYVSVLGSFVAIGLGKMVFGGLGMNLFNPAMVGRAFVMLSFASVLGASAYTYPNASSEILTQATPLTLGKNALEMPSMQSLFLGSTNGSVGETSALAILIGGAYLCIRRTAAWQTPAGVVIGAAVFGFLMHVLGLSAMTVGQQLLSGSLLFGAFFIATDPVSSPITPKGRWAFGLGIGALCIILRVFSSYPEGIMFAVLLMNALVPLINRWTIPTPVGGPVPVKK
jgi:electron transport complex protein RnfD